MVATKLENDSWTKGKQSLKAPGPGKPGSGGLSKRSLPREDLERGVAWEKLALLPTQKMEEQSQDYLVVLPHFPSQGLPEAEWEKCGASQDLLWKPISRGNGGVRQCPPLTQSYSGPGVWEGDGVLQMEKI